MFAETGERANIIVTNHVSYLDILAMMAYNETIPAFVSKKEVQKVPLFGWKSKIWQCIYVDRNAEKGMGVASQINTRATSFGLFFNFFLIISVLIITIIIIIIIIIYYYNLLIICINFIY